MHILAIKAVGQFVGLSFSDHPGAGRKQTLDGRCRARRRRMSLEPDRMAVAGSTAGNVEHVLDGEAQAAQRTYGHAVELNMRVTAERIVRVVRDHCGRCKIAGWRDTVLRPRLNA